MTRRLIGFLVLAQVALGLYRVLLLDLDLLRLTSCLPSLALPHAGHSLLWALLLLVASALWASLDSGPVAARFGAWGLAHLALAGLVPYLSGLAGLPLSRGAVAAALLLSAGAAFLLRTRRGGAGAGESVPFSPWDAATLLIALGLLVPTLFPYVHFDAIQIWACRAFAFESAGGLAGIGNCLHPGYPPLFSLLLWGGLDDPLFEGRLAAWLVIALFLLFLRGRLASRYPRHAAAATAFVAATAHVAVNAGMYYANAALMAFLSAGLLLATGLPGPGRTGGSDDAPGSSGPTGSCDDWRLRFLAGPLCLAAAALVRPDGLVYAAVAWAALLWTRVRDGLRLPLWPFGVVLAASATWMLRPAPLRFSASPFSSGAGEWRTVGRTPAEAAWAVVKVYLDSAQGQLLAHWGLGVAVPLLIGLASWQAVRERGVRSAGAEASARRLYLRTALLSLAAVLAVYIAVPFVGDPVAAVQPYEETGFLVCYRNFVRVGMGRMTVHLLPFWALFALSLVEGERGADAAR